MAVILPHSRSQELSDFVSLLESSDNKVRLTRYFAIAEVLAKNFLTVETSDNMNELLLKLNRIVDMVCELTIVDRGLFTNILTRVVKFHYYRVKPSNVAEELIGYSSFMDVLGVTKYYSTDEIFIINQNFNAYKDAMVITFKTASYFFQNND